jgi:hypothetical protein
MIGLVISIGAVTTLAWRADRMTPLTFELLVILIGIGFGPLPSLTAVVLQNVVPRHQLGISIGTMNFSRNLYSTILIAVFGAIVLTGTTAGPALGADAGAFSTVFLVAAASFATALLAMLLMQQAPLQSDAETAA